MNKIYDKLLLAIAVLALLAGVGFYVTKSGVTPTRSSAPAQLSDNPYQAIPIPGSTYVEADWPEPSVQSTTWVYDVFTPPKIYIGSDRKFTSEGWKVRNPDEVEKEIPFGVYLVDVKRDLYRIQFEGYIEEDLTDASKSLVLLSDEETGGSVRARVGKPQVDHEFELVEFTIERIKGDDGSITKFAQATILDNRTGETVVLTRGERLYQAGVTVTIRSAEYPELDLTLSSEGEAFETPSAQYVLEEIDLETPSITVKKVGTEELEEKIEQLHSRGITEKTSTIPEPIIMEVTDESDSFDFEF